MKKTISIAILTIILLTTMLPSEIFAATTSRSSTTTNISFTDIDDHWAKDSINLGASLGFVKGTGNNKFTANAAVNRESFISLIVRASGEESTRAQLQEFSPFSDVPNDRWSAQVIKTATTLGWINQSDYTNYMFEPTQDLTREEAASLLRALLFGQEDNVEEIQNTTSFKDNNSISLKHRRDVALLSSIGIIQGNNGIFNPKGTLTRGESITLILRAISYQSNLLSYISNVDGKYNTAMGYATSAFILSPNSASTTMLASSKMNLGKFEEAEKLYIAATDEGYDNPYAYSAAALAAYYQNDYEAAVEYQTITVELVPSDTFQLFLLAQYEGITGNYEKAIEYAEKAKKYDTQGYYTSDIEEFILFSTDLSSSPSVTSMLALKVNFFKKASDWIDKHSEGIQLVATALAFVPGAGTVASVALNTIVISNSAARVIALDGKEREEALASLMEDALGSVGTVAGVAIKTAGKTVTKAMGKALASKDINDRVMNEAISKGDWVSLTKLQKHEDAINSFLSTGSDINKSLKINQSVIEAVQAADGANDLAGGIFDTTNKWIKDATDQYKTYNKAPELTSVFSSWVGKWTFYITDGYGNLEISNVTNETLEFRHTTVAQNWYIGEIEGTATISGNKATFRTSEKDVWSNNACVVTLIASEQKVVVDAPYCSSFHGYKGFLGGTFEKPVPATIKSNVANKLKTTILFRKRIDIKKSIPSMNVVV